MDRCHVKFSLTSKFKYAVGATLLSLSFILYLYGITGPVLRITGGGPGPFEGQAGDHDFSMPRLLHLLLDEGDYVPFVCIFVFSFVLPVLKFTLITATLVSSACCHRRVYSVSLPLKIITVLRVVAKYQLVDVFSIIILVSFINFFGISGEPLSAARAYQAYCLLSIITTQWLCHCYSETLERCKLAECCGRFHVALCSPLLPRYIPVNTRMLGETTFSGCTTPVDFSEDSTTLSTQKWALGTSLGLPEYPQSSGLHWSSQGVRQRPSSRSHSPSPDGPCPNPASLSAELSYYTCSGYAQSTNIGVKSIPFGGEDGVAAIWTTDASRTIRAADLPASFMAFTRGPCLPGGRMVDELPHSLAQIPEGAAPEEPVQVSRAGLLGSARPRCCFSECLLRMCFLACSFCISAFAALICWVRPVLQVTLVPGKQRGFAIERSVMSLGDAFWRLYSMGHLWNGCLMIVVFPLLATLFLYVASIGTMASACVVYWAARSSNQLLACPMQGPVSQRSPNSTMSTAKKAMQVTKTLSNISALLGDIAMPDVQSIGLLACYFIANNVDFLGASLPGAPLGQPTGALERLLWNFSGFWAMVALGVSASQVHRLSISFEDVCQDMHASFYKKETANNQYLPSSLLSVLSEDPSSPRTELGGNRGFILDGSCLHLIPDAGVAYPSQLTGITDNSNTFKCNSQNKRYRSHSFGSLIHGCVRMAVSVALLLPIWLKPTDIVDVDLGIVNEQLQGFTEYINPLLKKMLPQSLGDCASAAHVAPPPCAGTMPLAYIRTKAYEAKARWATGLNTTELEAVRFDSTPRSRIVLTVMGKIKSLSLSLRIGGCFYGEDPGRCPVLWDGTDGCCGDDINFMFQMSVKCSSSFPYLTDASLLHTHVSRLVVKEKILGIFPVEVADITQIVENQLSEWARAFLDPKNKWIHWKDGATLSVVNLLNVLLNINAPAGIRCPSG